MEATRQRSIPDSAVCIYMDGNAFCCVFGDFENLQESPAGFGDDPSEAFVDLLSQTQCVSCEGACRVSRDEEVSLGNGESFVDRLTDDCPGCNGTGRQCGDAKLIESLIDKDVP